jgi:5-carboxymethyl-2-hydroxymuconate isomerase
MPKITLEYTSNVRNDSDWGGLVLQVHNLVSKVAGITIENCKSRILEHSRYITGAGGDNKAFVHLEVALLDGRSRVLKSEMGNLLLTLLQTQLLPENSQVELQITVEIRDIDRTTYFKYPKGTITPK